MAKRIAFYPTMELSPAFEERDTEFVYSGGFALSQKQKSIHSLHERILRQYPNRRPLEISTKSPSPLGVKLSAFNLKLYDEAVDEMFPIENIFQSSKVFEQGGPYRDLLHVSPKDAKRDERLRESGRLIAFEYAGLSWPLEPKSLFYDWIYIKALMGQEESLEKIVDYNVFTDIEFNHEKSVNCQARAAAIFVSLRATGRLDVLDDIVAFSGLYSQNSKRVEYEQESFLHD